MPELFNKTSFKKFFKENRTQNTETFASIQHKTKHITERTEIHESLYTLNTSDVRQRLPTACKPAINKIFKEKHHANTKNEPDRKSQSKTSQRNHSQHRQLNQSQVSVQV